MADRSKLDPTDAAAAETVRMLNVARLFDKRETAEKIFKNIARCEAFAEKEEIDDPDAVFMDMALEISTMVIQFATNGARLQQAGEWVVANGFAGPQEDSLSVLALLTLIYIINRGAKRYSRDPAWKNMKKRVEKLKPVRRAA